MIDNAAFYTIFIRFMIQNVGFNEKKRKPLFIN